VDRAAAILGPIARWGDRLPEHGGLAEFYLLEMVVTLEQRPDAEAILRRVVELLDRSHTVAQLAALAGTFGDFELPGHGLAALAARLERPGPRPRCLRTPLFQLGVGHVMTILDEALDDPALGRDVASAIALIAAAPAPALGWARLCHVLSSRDHLDKVAEIATWHDPIAAVLPGSWPRHRPEPVAARLPVARAVVDHLRRDPLPAARALAREVEHGRIEIAEVPAAALAARRPVIGGTPLLSIKALYELGDDGGARILVAERPGRDPEVELIDVLVGALHEFVHVSQARRHGRHWPNLALIPAEIEAFAVSSELAARHGHYAEIVEIMDFSGYGWRQALRNFVEKGYLGWVGTNGVDPAPYHRM
jgi:hypothetical protein